ncbi:helix-turn-helix transcriptional regulator [Pseudonocardia sp. H11422]|uniref:helix-turn-helix transcriptional regulator n=1 Tax=Pseudonocardia sp. H11422 TaxID=2835866 RepID=UPI001BDCCB81|nr:LuxR C-terminal-related transcriptional regulator [Pseudonocardia sp. H11422]
MAAVGGADGGWLDFVAELMAEPLTEWPEERIAGQLCETFELVGCAFSEQSDAGPIRCTLWSRDERSGGHRAEIETWGMHPRRCSHQTTGRDELIQETEAPDSTVDPRITAMWDELARRWGCADQIALPLRFEASRLRAFALGRTRPFSPAEIALADRVRLLLSGLDRQVEALVGTRRRAGPGTDDVAAAVRLTPRELAVLGLLAEGLTAVAIGRKLAIAERTVHKHLERTYAKLRVTDRLSAVLRAQRIGLLAGL